MRSPWPEDFFGYLTSLPGVTVEQGPEPVTIGGIDGTRIVVQMPAMPPFLWLKDDYTWLGGGKTGIDAASTRQFVLLDVHGKQVLLMFDAAPDTFAELLPQVNSIFDSITFDTAPTALPVDPDGYRAACHLRLGAAPRAALTQLAECLPPRQPSGSAIPVAPRVKRPRNPSIPACSVSSSAIHPARG